VRLTVLGKSPSFTDAGGACTGYLVEEGDVALLLDAGNGTFGRLRAARDYLAVDAVVVSHLHADHTLDLVPYAYALTYSPRRPDPPVRPALHVPPGAQAFFRRVVGAWGNEDLVEAAFALREYDPEEALAIGPLEVAFRPVPHFVPTQAVGLRGPGGRLVFGADHGPSEELVAFAREADLLLLEATLGEPGEGHLTPAQAGEHARRAGARRLVLTHFSDEMDAGWARAEAERAYGGPVELAREGASYDV
jgi:ribonuclease BN (tRNA processing enzyme)